MDCQAIIFEKLKKIIVEELEVDPDAVTPQASFACDLYCHDELDVVKLVMAVEEEFDIEIPEEVTDCIATVQQAVDYLVIKCSPALEERLEEIQARIELIADYWTKLDVGEEEAINLTRKAFNVIKDRNIASKRKELSELRAKFKAAKAEAESIKAKIEQCEKDIE